jgi:NAD+ kinase
MIQEMNPPVRRIGMILKRADPRVQGVVADVIPWLVSRGLEVFLDQAPILPQPVSLNIVPQGELASKVDVVTVFGGDGTLLYAARILAESGVPILGINLGSLGFLTEVKPEEIHSALENLLSGEYQLQERMLLDVEISKKSQPVIRYLALNDAVINKGTLARIIDLEVSINSQLVTVTRSDGLIISTPTGSTGYSLSAGGPILYPTLAAFIITPICPHTLTNRPVVVSDGAVVGVCLRHGADVMLTVDGQIGMPLQEGDCLRVRKAAPVIRLVQTKESPFFRLLREKLKWG